MISFIKLSLVTFLLLLLLDGAWLKFVAQGLYAKYLGYLFPPLLAIICYASYAAIIAYFVIRPALKTRSLHNVLKRGAFLGFLSYGIYEFANLSTLSMWPWYIALLELGWGMFMTALVSGITFRIFKK